MIEVSNPYSIEELAEGIRRCFNDIVKINTAEWNLSKEETKKQERMKSKLRFALKHCSYGDAGAKAFIKDHIKDLLQKKLGIKNTNIDQAICFDDPGHLSIQDKFEILLYQYSQEFGSNGFVQLVTQYDLDEVRYKSGQPFYEIAKRDIEDIFWNENKPLCFEDKLAVLTQRIYQLYKGHGVVDLLLDECIDGISAGVSTDIQSVWIFFQGKTIPLSFLRFHDEKELERICKNIYRYNNPGQLSAVKGYLTNDRKDGSRVVVMRPPFAESWAFFIRKFDTVRKSSLEDLVTDSANKIPIETLKWLVKGCQVMGITGTQGCGKTTLLMALIQYINPTYTLRIQELTFELNLRKLYPDRNILTFKETDSVSGQEGLDLMKKTDGTVTILGEVATASVASWLVELSQVASLFTLFTHHAKTTKDLITALRNALLQAGGFSNEMIAMEQVVDTIHFDIHMDRNIDGHRYIERITEVISLGTGRYQEVEIVALKNGRYQLLNALSDRANAEILAKLTVAEKLDFLKYTDTEVEHDI